MLIALKLIINLLILCGAAYLCGTLFIKKGERDALPLAFVMGFFIMIAVLEPIYMVITALDGSFTILAIIYGVVLAALCGIALWREDVFDPLRRFVRSLKEESSPLWWITAAGIVIQGTLTTVFFNRISHRTGDDDFHLGAAQSALDLDRLWVTNPHTGEHWAYHGMNTPWRRFITCWDMIYACGAKLFHIKAVTYAKGTFGIVMLVMAFCAVWIFSGIWFEKKKERTLFLFFVFIAAESAYGFATSWPNSLLTRPWQSRSILFGMVLPMFFYFMNRLCRDAYENERLRDVAGLFLVNMTACAISTMAILCFVPAAGLIWLLYMISSKKLIAPWGIAAGFLPQIGAMVLLFVMGFG